MEQKNIPVLRFPEFEGEWEKKRLGDVTTKVGSGSTPLGGEKSYQSDGVVFIRSQNVNNDALNLHDVVYISEAINKKMEGSQVTANDILLNITGASIGRSCVVPSDFKIGNVNQHVSIIRLIEKFTPYFLQPLLSSAKGQKLISESQAGGGREGLNFQNIRSFKIYFPTLPEQQKIATFFTAIDQKISQLKKKHQLLEQYKKGVMQQIFSQQIRFKDDDGREFPKWEKKRLGELIEEVSEKSDKSNQFRVISSTAKGLFFQDEYFNREIASADSTGYKILRLNQLVFSPQNLWLGNINVNTSIDIGIVSPSYKIFEFKKTYTFPNYCKYFLLTHKMMFSYEMCSEQGASIVRRNLNMSLFFEIPLLLPSLPEQTKIANFLSVIDDKIHHTQKQIEQAEQWKKGLMQKMFV
jgi:type I restriction enzyme S subunit